MSELLKPNPFTHAIRSGQKQVGLWISLCSNIAADVIAPSGFDWVLLDMEHAPNELQTVIGQLQAFDSSSTTAIVRPMWSDPVVVKRLLDSGAQGLLFPMVQSVAEAERAVASTRYPPRGIRGVSGSTRANKFGRVSDYFDRVEQETTVIVQVETVAALEQAEAIAAVDGVDGIFFGPADIGADIGQLGKPMAPEVWDLIRPVADRLITRGIPLGTIVSDLGFATKLLNDGFTFVACGNDTGLLADAADSVLASVKQGLA